MPNHVSYSSTGSLSVFCLCMVVVDLPRGMLVVERRKKTFTSTTNGEAPHQKTKTKKIVLLVVGCYLWCEEKKSGV